MAWRLSTGFMTALLGGTPNIKASVIGTTLSQGDGDGTGGNDTIADSGAGLGVFAVGDWLIIAGGSNENILAQVVLGGTGVIEVPAGTYVAQAAGTEMAILNMGAGGSVQKILENGTIDEYSGVRPTSSDDIESGTKLLSITRDGLAMTPGTSTNGLNMAMSGTTLKRAIDSITGITEVWKGAGVADGTAGWARWYSNDKTTGASTTGIRMDGVVATSGGDINMVNGTTIATGIYSEVSDISMTMTAV